MSRLSRLSLAEAIGVGVLVGIVVIAVMAAVIGLSVAIAYFFVYKIAVHLGMTRANAFALSVFYYVGSSLGSSIYLSGRKSR